MLDSAPVPMFDTEGEAISSLRRAMDECAARAPKPPKANPSVLEGKHHLANVIGPKNAHAYMSAMVGDLRSYTGGRPHPGVNLTVRRDADGVNVVAMTVVAGRDWLFSRFYQVKR